MKNDEFQSHSPYLAQKYEAHASSFPPLPSLLITNGTLTTQNQFISFHYTKIVAAVSWPIVDPDHKAFVNVGFQFNYNMPYTPSSFYDPMYWRRALPNDAKPQNETGSDDAKNITKRQINDVETHEKPKYHSELDNEMDISAGELYKSWESFLVE